MLKAILIFIKTHVILTTITVTVAGGATVAASVIVNNYILDKNVKENLGMLVSSDYVVKNYNENSNIIDNNQVSNEDIKVNTNKPLTFRIERVVTKKNGGNIVKDMQGNDAIEGSSETIEYKIIPSYDKDYSKWTKEEKEAYQKAYEDAAKMTEEDYNKNVVNEEQAMENASKEVERVTSKIESSYSEEYILGWFPNSSGYLTAEAWKYNYYTKLYSGGSQEEYGTITKEYGDLNILNQGIPATGITVENFRNKVYPALTQKIKKNQEMPKEERQEILNKLDKLYHLAD